jgi:hypothetical protein
MSTPRSSSGATEVKLASPEVCQLVSQDDALQPLTPLEHALRTAKRKARGLLRRLGIVHTHPLDARHAPPWRRPVMPSSTLDDAPEGDAVASADAGRASGRGGHLQAGDLVRVKPLGAIMKTLDSHRRYQGLQFLHPMAEHCGKTYRVLKRVRRLVNDMDHTVRKAKSVVILDGVLCHGKGIYGREDCDRTCFFFWKEAWLTKVDEEGGTND